MIRSQRALKAALAAGETVACGPLSKWSITSTNETVSRAAIKRLRDKGDLAVLQNDIAGDPMQYGAVQ